MPLLVADIGNSRLKWGLCSEHGIDTSVSLPHDDPAAWKRQFDAWNVADPSWVVASVVPDARDRFVRWLKDAGHAVRVLDSQRKLPIETAVDNVDRVGIDRLLDAVAAKSRGTPASIIDAGSAVTVDLVDASGVFRGGAILPGLRLMARSLNDYTAQLPIVDITARVPPPGTSTTDAIATGVLHAVVGGIDRLLDDMAATRIWLTGGDAALLAPHLKHATTVWPEMTLEGIRLSST